MKYIKVTKSNHEWAGRKIEKRCVGRCFGVRRSPDVVGGRNQSPSPSTPSQTLVSLHIHCHCVTGQSFCFLHKMSLPSLQERPVGCRNGGGSWSQYQTGRLASFSGAARVGESAPAGFPFIGSGRTSTWDEITSPWPMQMGGNGVPGRRGTLLGHMQVGGR